MTRTQSKVVKVTNPTDPTGIVRWGVTAVSSVYNNFQLDASGDGRRGPEDVTRDPQKDDHQTGIF